MSLNTASLSMIYTNVIYCHFFVVVLQYTVTSDSSFMENCDLQVVCTLYLWWMMDEWNWVFTTLSTVFLSYWDDSKMIMTGCVQCISVYLADSSFKASVCTTCILYLIIYVVIKWKINIKQ